MTTPRILIGVAGAIILLSVTLLGLLFLPDTIADTRTQAAFQLYSGAERLFESLAQYSGGADTKRVYYWSGDTLETIQAYYESIMPVFRESIFDNQGQWLITGFKLDSTQRAQPQRETASPYLIHDSFCDYTQQYSCVTLSLIDLAQQDSLELPVTISSTGTYDEEELVNKLGNLPSEGVLMVYAYYVNRL
jgi:hypothetical protein